jgi:exopolysaccharide production protein ExoQ
VNYSILKAWRKLETILSVLLLMYVTSPNLQVRTGAPAVFEHFDRLLVSIYYLFVLIVFIQNWRKILYFLLANKVLLLFLLLPLLSILWSINPEVSQSRFLRVVIRSTIFGLYLASRYTPKELIRLIGWALGLLTLFSFLTALGVPSYGKMASGIEWRGVFPHKNYLGITMVLSTTYFISLTLFGQNRKKLYFFMFVLSFIILLSTQAKSSLSICFGALMLLPLYRSLLQAYRTKILLQTIGLFSGVSLTMWLSHNLEYIIVDVLGKSMALNGRTPVWNYLLEQVAKRPFLGFGYEAFWNDPDQVALGHRFVAWFPSHAHSGFIDLLLHFGLLGFSLFVIASLMTLIRLFYLLSLKRSFEYFWMILFFIVMLSSQFSVAIYILKDHILWILYISFSASAVVELRRLRKPRVREIDQPLLPAHQS